MQNEVYYRFLPAEVAQGIVTDESGNGRNGVLINGPTAIATGGVLLNAAKNQYVQIPAFALKAPTYSMVIKVACTKLIRSQTFIGDASQSGTVGFIFIYRPANTDSLTIQYSNGATYIDVPILDFFKGLDGIDTIIGVTVNTAINTIEVSRNESLFETVTVTDNIVFPTASRIRYIGAYDPADASHPYFLNGAVKEFALYGGEISVPSAGTGIGLLVIGAVGVGLALLALFKGKKKKF